MGETRLKIEGIDFDLLQRELRDFNGVNGGKLRLQRLEEQLRKLESVDLKVDRVERELKTVGQWSAGWISGFFGFLLCVICVNFGLRLAFCIFSKLIHLPNM
jgi:hypothetical protein